MRKLLIILPIVGLFVFSGLLSAGATQGDCATFENHSGHVPGSYDYAEFYEDGQLVTTVQTNGQDIFVDPQQYDAGSKWDQVRKCHYTELTEQPVQIGGGCILDQAGQARAVFSAEGRPGAVFTVNGINIGGALSGGTGVFGVNAWSVTALEGYVIVGPTEGSFTIEDCGTTTTIVAEPTTTTLPVTTTAPDLTTTAPVPSTPTTAGPSAAPELPFTGPASVIGLTLLGLLLVGLGVYSVQWGDDE